LLVTGTTRQINVPAGKISVNSTFPQDGDFIANVNRPCRTYRTQSEIYKKSSIDLALRDAFRKMRRFLMTTRGLSEDEAISLMSVAVDFGVTQVVDGNWGIHAIIKKSIFAGGAA
jgi:acetamidase/formamidase